MARSRDGCGSMGESFFPLADCTISAKEKLVLKRRSNSRPRACRTLGSAHSADMVATATRFGSAVRNTYTCGNAARIARQIGLQPRLRIQIENHHALRVQPLLQVLVELPRLSRAGTPTASVSSEGGRKASR